MVASLYRLVLDEPCPLWRGPACASCRGKLRPAREAALGTFFREQVLPVLPPLAIDTSRPFPLLSSLSLNLALRLEAPPGEPARLAVVQVPQVLTRLVQLADSETLSFVLLEDVISAHLPSLFPGQAILESAVVRLARDSELELDDEGGRTHIEVVERELRRRRRSDVVRLEITANASDELVVLLRDQLDLGADDVYVIPGPLDLRVMMGLLELPGLEGLRDPQVQPVDVLADAQQSDIFSVLDERDLLLHHPYEAYDPVVALLAQAADDPDVLAIKQTLYRMSAGSPSSPRCSGPPN